MRKENRVRPGGMHGPGGMMQGGEKARDFKGTMRRLIEHLDVYRASIVVVIIFAIASSTFSIIGPRILGKATTRIFEGVMAKIAGTGNIDFDYIRSIILLLLVIYGISSLFRYF